MLASGVVLRMSNAPWLMEPIYNASKIFGNIIILFASQIGTWRSDVLTARALQSWQMIFPMSNAPTVPLIWLMANMSSTSHTRTRATATFFRITNRVKIENSTQDYDWEFLFELSMNPPEAISGICQLVTEPAQNIVWHHFLLQSSTSIRYMRWGITSCITIQTSCTGASVHKLTLIWWNWCMKFIKYKITENRKFLKLKPYNVLKKFAPSFESKVRYYYLSPSSSFPNSSSSSSSNSSSRLSSKLLSSSDMPCWG